LFSAQPFPDYQTKRGLLRSEYGEQWYEWDAEHMQGWLCSVLFKYFLKRLIRLYGRAEPAVIGPARCQRPTEMPPLGSCMGVPAGRSALLPGHGRLAAPSPIVLF